MEAVLDGVLWFRESQGPLKTFGAIWYDIFIWCLLSSLFLYSFATAGAFFTLRKHKFGSASCHFNTQIETAEQYYVSYVIATLRTF